MERSTETAYPHTMSVLQVDADFKYWCWYGMDTYPSGGPVYLAKSNDLLNWTKAGSVIAGSNRWPSVRKVGSTYYMGVTKWNAGTSLQSTVLKSSSDGLSWSDVGVLAPETSGYYNDNSQIYLDPVSNDYYYLHTNIRQSDSFHTVYIRHATNITDLLTATDSVVLTTSDLHPDTEGTTLASPNVIYYNGFYYLTTEILIGGVWKTIAWRSKFITFGYSEFVNSNPILSNDDACLFHHIFDNTLHVFYSERVGGTTWNMQHRSSPL